jgi:hypothetical protein
MLQPGVSASAHSSVSASTTAVCFSIQQCFSIYYSTVFQHILQHCVSAYTTAAYTQHCVSAYATAWCFSISYSGVSASKKLNRK